MPHTPSSTQCEDVSGNAEGRELSSRQKSFCVFYAQHGNAAEAARAAGYSSANAADTGWRILQNPQVADHIEALQLAGLSEAERIHDELIGKLEHVYQLALENGNLAAAVRSIEAEGRLRLQAARYDALKMKNRDMVAQVELAEAEAAEHHQRTTPSMKWFASELTLTPELKARPFPAKTGRDRRPIKTWKDYLEVKLSKTESLERDQFMLQQIRDGGVILQASAASDDPASPEIS